MSMDEMTVLGKVCGKKLSKEEAIHLKDSTLVVRKKINNKYRIIHMCQISKRSLSFASFFVAILTSRCI